MLTTLLQEVMCVISGLNPCGLAPKLLLLTPSRHQIHSKTNVIRYNLAKNIHKIYFQLQPENNIFKTE